MSWFPRSQDLRQGLRCSPLMWEVVTEAAVRERGKWDRKCGRIMEPVASEDCNSTLTSVRNASADVTPRLPLSVS